MPESSLQESDTDPAEKPARRSHLERTELSDRLMLDATEALILELGTQKTTLKEVGERAGYSRGLAHARFGNKETLLPELIYVNDDRDGGAVSSDQWGVQLTYASIGARYNLILTGNYSESDYDQTHPIYGKTRNDNGWGAGMVVFDKQLMQGLGKDWWASATVGYYESDSNINFYDSTLWTVGLGVMYRF